MTDPLALHFLQHHPAEAAASLESLEPAALTDWLAQLPAKPTISALRFISPHKLAHCLAALPSDCAARVLEQLPTTRAVTILRVMEPASRERFQAALPLSLHSLLTRLSSFAPGTVGAAMDTDAQTLPLGIRVEEALRRIRQDPETAAPTAYVVDHGHRLVGRVPVHNLLLARGKLSIDALLDPQPPSFSAQSPLHVIEQHPVWTQYTQVAVTDRQGRFLGVLNQAEMIAALDSHAADPYRASTSGTLFDLADLIWSSVTTLVFPFRERRPTPGSANSSLSRPHDRQP